MSEYTPTTEEVRNGYVGASSEPNPYVSEYERAEFDRWLAEVKRGAQTAAISWMHAERERIINDLAADCNHAEPWCYHRDVIKLIRGEDND